MCSQIKNRFIFDEVFLGNLHYHKFLLSQDLQTDNVTFFVCYDETLHIRHLDPALLWIEARVRLIFYVYRTSVGHITE